MYFRLVFFVLTNRIPPRTRVRFHWNTPNFICDALVMGSCADTSFKLGGGQGKVAHGRFVNESEDDQLHQLSQDESLYACLDWLTLVLVQWNILRMMYL